MLLTHIDITIAIALAYCIGSIPSAVIICRFMQLPDPRTQGSGNPGTTNVLRLGGKKAAFLTLCCDILKGVIPVLTAKYYELSNIGLSFVALAAFMGHVYPAFTTLKGGKGVATALGSLTALAWPIGLALASTWLIVAFTFRYSSLAAIIAALLAPFYAWYLTHNLDYTFCISIMTSLLVIRHQQNLRNLLTGRESKIGKAPQPID